MRTSVKNQYTPDGWVVIEIKNPKETYYKIFGSWSSFSDFNDYWRLSSGSDAIKLIEGKKTYIWEQYSGSTYILMKGCEGKISESNNQVLELLLEELEIVNTCTNVVPVNQLMKKRLQ